MAKHGDGKKGMAQQGDDQQSKEMTEQRRPTKQGDDRTGRRSSKQGDDSIEKINEARR